MPECALGVDVGTSATKVGLFDVADGRPLAVSAQPYRLDTPHAGWAELDPEEYWAALVRGMREAMRDAGPGAVPVSIGIACQGQTFVMLDAEARPVRRAIAWLDVRAPEELAEFAAAIPSSEYFRRAGTPFPSLIESASKILWVRGHEPEAFARVRHVLVLSAYIAHRLTGRMVADPGGAASTGLFDQERMRWWPEAVEAVGLLEDMLGEAAHSATIIGGLTRNAAGELGLPEGLPVGVGANDQVCAVVAMGHRGPGHLAGAVGTSLSILGALPAASPFPQGARVIFSLHPIGRRRLLFAYVKAAGAALAWFRDRFAPGMEYEELIAEAEGVPPGSEGLIALPHLTGMATPSFDERARGAFVGVTLAHGRGHFVRALLEGVCFAARDSLALLRGLGVEGDAITLSGGATRSDLWMRMLADTLGVPITVPACAEAACRGGALLGLLAIGREQALAWPSGHGPTDRYEPEPSNAARYDDAYAKYVRTMDALHPGAR